MKGGGPDDSGKRLSLTEMEARHGQGEERRRGLQMSGLGVEVLAMFQ